MNMNTDMKKLKEAAFEFSKSAIKKGYQFEGIHEYQDVDGRAIYWRFRFKNYETGDKYIRPMQLLENGEYAMEEPDFGGKKKPLYNLHALSTTSSSSNVYIVEGEVCVEALAKIGVLGVTSGSADSVLGANWEVLSGRKVIIWPDNDTHGERFLNSVVGVLEPLNCEIWQIDINALNLAAKDDVVDWLDLNPNATASDIAKLSVTKPANQRNDTEKSQNKREKQSSILVDFAVSCVELFHDDNSKAYAQDLLTKETYLLDGSRFKRWLTSSYYRETEQIPSEQSIKECINTLAGLAIFRGECHKVYIRVAKLDDAYYIDLAIPQESHAICITSEEWKIVESPPVKFVRLDSMHQLPIPVSGGDISSLWRLVNVPEASRLLVIAWLIDALRPDTPFPVLELVGEQGSAKSTTQAILRRLIDPSICDLRGAPKTPEDIYISGRGNWIVSYENISHLSLQMQDSLCIIATGGGFAKRKNYTDVDESIISVKRPIVLNGISAAITAQDLVDRVISIETPVVINRKEVNEIWMSFEERHANFFGAVLDIFVKSLARLHEIQAPTENCPRLIEYARLGMAIAEVQGGDGQDFLTAFNAARTESVARTIDSCPVALALIELFEDGKNQKIECSLSVLLNRLDNFKQGCGDSWPRTAKSLGDTLRRMAPALRQSGVGCKSLGKMNGYVHWRVEKCN